VASGVQDLHLCRQVNGHGILRIRVLPVIKTDPNASSAAGILAGAQPGRHLPVDAARDAGRSAAPDDGKPTAIQGLR
jgi:hypothetical protein